MGCRTLYLILITSILVCFPACNSPSIPPEVYEAKLQAGDLWREGAPDHFPQEYEEYLRLTEVAKDAFFRVQAKIVWFRKYEETAAAYRTVISQGDTLLQRLKQFKSDQELSTASRLAILRKQMKTIKDIGLLVNDKKYMSLTLARVDLLASEAEMLVGREEYTDAATRLADAEYYLKESQDHLMTVLQRYNDESLIRRWRNWVDETIAQSRREGIYAIVVVKIDQTLILYKNGAHHYSCKVSLGKNSLFDKLHSGDQATPEGKYKISKKMGRSRYYKAFLIDYPNASDQESFRRNKQRGLIPRGVGIGGLIEIHGGGSDSITRGCVSLANADLDRIFPLVDVGTPVMIVGSTRTLKDIIEQRNGRLH